MSNLELQATNKFSFVPPRLPFLFMGWSHDWSGNAMCRYGADEGIFYRKLAVSAIVYQCSLSESFMTSSYTQNIKWRTYYWQYCLTDIYSRKILIPPGTAWTWNLSTSERITASSSTVSQTTRFPTIPGTGARNYGGKTNGETWVRNCLYSLKLSNIVQYFSWPTRCLTRVSLRPSLMTSTWWSPGLRDRFTP